MLKNITDASNGIPKIKVTHKKAKQREPHFQNQNQTTGQQ